MGWFKMNNRTKSIAIIVSFTVYLIFLIIFYPKAVELIVTSNILVSIVLYLIFNIAYSVLLFSAYTLSKRYGKKAWKRAIGSVLLVASFAMIEMPRFVITSPLTNGYNTLSNMGAIVMSRLDVFLPHTISFYMFYMVIPLLFFICGLELVGIVNFIKKIKNGEI